MGWSASPPDRTNRFVQPEGLRGNWFCGTAREGVEGKKNRLVCFPELQAAVSNSATILLHGTAGLPSPLRATRPACSSALTSSKAFL